MLKPATTILTSTPLLLLPALGADAQAETGITGVGPAMVIFTLAGALLLTLVFRSAARHVTRFVTARIGQRRIRTALEKRSPDVLHDFILPGAYGGLVKIDHAILTAGGILCIQSKHYNGIVFGAEDEAQWTNVDGVKRRRFLNPLIQNEGRSRALRQVVPDVPVANLVIFTGSVEFTSAPPRNVIHVRDLESFVARFVFGPSKVKDWDTAWLTVKAAAMTDTESRKDLQAQLTFT
ncbi:MAG: NERD domain-containing protein [Gammaproteobacteria bacterium]|nr:NERD domain-containing protein [Gammaproteobacteria bacterium]MBT8111356.1 NERD domain-containing protein [Gammaproteobacteria bacterium]NND47919.1 NERD domain-containing protein [Woeseiaceae bacterium]NNL46054.1 NERD domain-containing protein [Woeseiaceae bacterium]